MPTAKMPESATAQVSAGTQYAFNRNALLETSKGYLSHCSYFVGASLLDQNFNHVRINPGAFAGVGFPVRFGTRTEGASPAATSS
jgi:hypothetical protein